MNNGNIFVVVEEDNGVFRDVTLELLGDARSLSSKFSREVWAVVLRGKRETPIEMDYSRLAEHGADRILLVEHEQLDPYVTEAHVSAIQQLSGRFSPALIMAAASVKGLDYAPRLAARLGSAYAADCLSFKVTPSGEFAATRPCSSGKVHETLILDGSGPYIVTLRPDVAGIGKPTGQCTPQIERVAVDLDPSALGTRVIETVPADPATVDLTEAAIIVAGGSGVGEGNWTLIEDLAQALNGSIGASRVAVDLGWTPSRRQVGQSGKIVNSKLYIACGISGASQHLAGIGGCESVVAINSDKMAPIMKRADLAALGDLREIIPALLRKITDARSAQASSLGRSM